MKPEFKPKSDQSEKQVKSGDVLKNKTFLIIITCWFLCYIFISLTGGGG